MFISLIIIMMMDYSSEKTNDIPVTDSIPIATTNDDIPVTDCIPPAALSTIKNVLFVNSAVISLNAYTNSETMEVGYENTYTSEDLYNQLHNVLDMSLNRVGFAFHYAYSPFKSSSIPVFINQEPFFTDSDLGESVVTYSRNVQFMLDFLLLKGFTHVDFLACDTLLDDKWRLYYQLLQSKTGAVIGASDNNTGSLKYGGDWVMESTHEDVGLIYFTDAIDNWASLLAIPTGLNTYYHTFYTVNTADLTIMTRKIYDNTGTLKDTQDISYGGVNISDALTIMESGGTNPYAVGIEDASLNKISMDVAYYGVYKKPLTETQQALLMTKVNTTYKEPHTNMTAQYTVSVSPATDLSATSFACMRMSDSVNMSFPISLTVGNVYLFDQSDSTNSGYTLKLSSTKPTLTQITSGVTVNSTPGSLNAYTIVSPLSALSAYCYMNRYFYYVKVATNDISFRDFTISSTSSTGTYYHQPSLTFTAGNTYKFYVSDTSVIGNSLVFGSITGSNETLNTNLYTVVGTPGNSGAYVLLDVSAGYTGPTIQYFEQTSSKKGYYPFVATPISVAYPDISGVWYKFEAGDITGTVNTASSAVKNYVNTTLNGTTGSKTPNPLIYPTSSSIKTTTSKFGASSLYLSGGHFIAINSNLKLTSSMTISMWVKKGFAYATSDVFPIWQYSHNLLGYSAFNNINIEYKSKIQVYCNSTNTKTLTEIPDTINFATDGKWHHMCIVITSTAATFYYDNISTALPITNLIDITKSYSYRFLGTVDWFSNGQTMLTSPVKAFQGYVDDYRMYNYALTAADVRNLYNYINEVTYTVRVNGGTFYMNDVSAIYMIIDRGNRYIYDQSDTTNTNRRITFSLSSTVYTTPAITDVSMAVVGTPGQVGAYTNLLVPITFTGNLYAW